LGGGLPQYNLYRASDGWVAVAALEPHFWEKIQRELGLHDPNKQALEQVFAARSATDWDRIPLSRAPKEKYGQEKTGGKRHRRLGT
jgi:crotonobetainyl-CoA:carnitine CoA-transferase CaiB-like acyl-CoA transferase